MNKYIVNLAALVAMTTFISGAHAGTVTWTDWTSISGSSASGTLGGVSVSVSATGSLDGVSQTSGPDTNYWTEPNAADRPYTGGSISNAPTPNEQVGLNTANSVTVTFGSAVSSLYMALLSVGQPNQLVSYDFDQAFTIDSEGQGYWGNDVTDGVLGAGDSLSMKEFHGVINFNAPVTTLNFTTSPNENWHAFTFAAGASSVSEPSILALLGLGLLGTGLMRRRQLKKVI